MFTLIAIKLTLGFVGILITMRIIGKKALSELTPFDIIYSFLLGGILEEAIYDDRIQLVHIFFALGLWGIIIFISEILLQRSEKLTRYLKGYSSVLIYENELNIDQIRNNHIEMEQLRSILREKGCFSLKQVKYVVMEPNGKVSVIKNEDVPSVFTYLLVDEGVVEVRSLKSLGKDKKWLQKNLLDLGYPDIEKLVYVEWSKQEGFYCKTYENCIHEKINIDG